MYIIKNFDKLKTDRDREIVKKSIEDMDIVHIYDDGTYRMCKDIIAAPATPNAYMYKEK